MSQPTITGSHVIDPFTPDPRLLVRWFVQYNPMFTASALCVLGGVLLLSQALHGAGDGSDGVVALGLTAIVELYQWLLIGTAALLYRRLHEHRPGVILGLIALVFLCDPTLQLSALASSGHVAVTVLWVVGVALKLHALQWAFCLRLSTSARLLPVLGAMLVAALPHARLMDDMADAVPMVLAIGVFVIGALAAVLPPRVGSVRALGELGQQMFPRLLKASVAIFVVGALYQGANAVFAVGPQALLATAGALALTVAMQLRREHEAWLWSALVVSAICMASAHLATAVGFPMAAMALLLVSRHHAPRVMTAGLLAAAVPSLLALRRNLSQAGAFEHAADIAIVVVVTLAMMWLLWQRRAPSALIGLAIVHQRTVTTVVVPALASQGSGTWGFVLVGAGFALLPLGVVAHRRLSQLLKAEDDARASDDSGDTIDLSRLSTPSASVSPGV
jgi:hypothetical protein